MIVSNMTSTNGNAVANQFLISGLAAGTFHAGNTPLPSGDAFQSYKTLIAYRTYQGKLYLDRNAWDYSRTTSKYRNMFTGLTTKETEKRIASGDIELIDLN